MACLNITNGLFNNGLTWNSGTTPVTTANGATVTNVPNGPAPGCSVEKNGFTEFFPKPLTGAVRFMVFGNPANFVAILVQNDNAGFDTRTVSIVDVSGTGAPVVQLVRQLSVPNAVGLPRIEPSQGNGSVFMYAAADGSGALANIFASIHLSRNGDELASAVPFHAVAGVVGEATTTELLIKEGATVRGSGARPRGLCKVVTDPLNFPEAVLNAANPALATTTRTVDIRNDGNDCLTINSVGNVAPYSVVSSTPALPVTLDPGQKVTVTIRFAPPAVGTHNKKLPVSTTPVNGDDEIDCRGTAREAKKTVSFSAALPFGTVPLGATASRTLTVTNNGEANITLAGPSIAGTEYTLTSPAFGGAPLAPGASASVTIEFKPTAEGPVSQALSFTSNAATSPHSVTLSGTGCVPRPRIEVLPLGPNIDFGQVQRGFRTVRIVRVSNPGNAPLNFHARIAGGNPLFGVQVDGGSITSPQSDVLLTVNPPTACGALATGSGEVVFAVTFFADAVPGLQTGQLIIDNHNAPAGPASFSFPLQAEVIAGISVDAELVIDRSGSMDGLSGPRKKIEVALNAARLFVQLARPDVEDRFGSANFDTQPLQVRPIEAITSANQAAMVNDFVLTNFTPAGGTAIAGGIVQALRDMAAHPRTVAPPELNKAIVVLTDANDNTPYLNPDDGVSYNILGEDGFTPVTVPPDVRLYGVGIGDDVDIGRLGQLCPTTGGQFLHVHDFSGTDFFKLEKHFTQIYMAAVDMAQISDPTFWIQPNQEHRHEFHVLRGDVTVMVVIFDRDFVRLPFWLETPQGELIEPLTLPPGFQIRSGITFTARFIELRLPQGEPDRYAGKWTVRIRHDGKFCTAYGRAAAAPWRHETHGHGDEDEVFGFSSTRCVPEATAAAMYGIAIGAGSNFRLLPFVDPAVVSVGDPIRLNALLSEFSLPVKGSRVTVTARSPIGALTTLTLLDDGAHNDGSADDGDYGGSFIHTQQEGMYEFVFRAEGQSRDKEPVAREATLSKYVQGRDKLVPPGGPGQPGGGVDECCTKARRWMWIVQLLGVLILIVLLLILRKL